MQLPNPKTVTSASLAHMDVHMTVLNTGHDDKNAFSTDYKDR